MNNFISVVIYFKNSALPVTIVFVGKYAAHIILNEKTRVCDEYYEYTYELYRLRQKKII
jgi:hypothetical protein